MPTPVTLMHSGVTLVVVCLCTTDLGEPARGAAERAQTHPLLLHQHLLLPDASPRPQGGDQPALRRQDRRCVVLRLLFFALWRKFLSASKSV